MDYWGRPADVHDVSQKIRDPKKIGISSADASLVALLRGLKATYVDGSVGRIKRAIDRGVPPIIMVESGGGLFHFFVVTGYNDKESLIVCEEYGSGKRLIGYEELETVWEKPKHYMVEIEASKADDLYREAGHREAKGLFAEAEALFKKALEMDPDHYEARVGLGNCLLALGKPEPALAEYRKAQAVNSADPRVLNNLANALLELKRETTEAEALSSRAVEEYQAIFARARRDMEAETVPAFRSIRQREVLRSERDLAHALGTLGQARAANGQHASAIAAWKASYDHFPLTESYFRAKRLYEMGLSYRAAGMPAEGRQHLQRALDESTDPAQKSAIESALPK
jgi:tetratricopeptide (TPR) repeat protein